MDPKPTLNKTYPSSINPNLILNQPKIDLKHSPKKPETNPKQVTNQPQIGPKPTLDRS